MQIAVRKEPGVGGQGRTKSVRQHAAHNELAQAIDAVGDAVPFRALREVGAGTGEEPGSVLREFLVEGRVGIDDGGVNPSGLNAAAAADGVEAIIKS